MVAVVSPGFLPRNLIHQQNRPLPINETPALGTALTTMGELFTEPLHSGLSLRGEIHCVSRCFRIPKGLVDWAEV
jgi:hypothetical protein